MQRFVLDYHQMKVVMTIWKCATTSQRVYNYSNYHLFWRFQGRFYVADFFNNMLIYFVYAGKTFFMGNRKDSVGNFMARCSICCEWSQKNAWVLAKNSNLQKMNIKNESVVTANCNVYNETLHILYIFCYRKAEIHQCAEKNT